MVIKNLENKIKLVGIICSAFLMGCIIISVSSIWTARCMVTDAQQKVYVLDGNVPILVNRTTMEETLDVEPMMDFLKAHKEDMPNISMMTIWPDYANAWWNIRHSAPRISPCAREWRSTIKTLSARLCVLWSRTYANYAICDRFCAHINRINHIDCITKRSVFRTRI